MIVVLIIDMNEKHIRAAARCDSDAIQIRKQNPAFDFILILKVDELFHESFDDVLRFQNIEYCLIGDHQYALLALALAIVLEDIGREEHFFLVLKKALKFRLSFQA